MSAWDDAVDWFDSSLDTDVLDVVRTVGLASWSAGLAVIGIVALFPETEITHHVGAAIFGVVMVSVGLLVWRRYRIVQRRLRETGVPTRLRDTI